MLPLAAIKSSSVMAFTLEPQSSNANPSESHNRASNFGSSQNRGETIVLPGLASADNSANRAPEKEHRHRHTFHAIVGGHQNAGEVARVGHAMYADLLQPQRFFKLRRRSPN